jgi:ATP-dependent Clp protease protease subunit
MSDKLKDDISPFHDHGIYIPRRTVELFGEVDLDQFKKVFRNLHSLDKINKDINLVINCEGGCVTQGKAIYQAIKGCDSHVTGIVYGEAVSASTFILQACDTRIMTPTSYMMIHYGTEHLPEDHPSNLDSAYKAMIRDREWMEKIYVQRIREKHPKYTLQKIRSLLKFDTYMSAKEALELGLIDEIKECL